MRGSVRWIVFFSSLAVSLIAILAVGTITLLLVERNFKLEEKAFLTDRGQQMVTPLEGSLRPGTSNIELQQLATIGLLTERVRVRVISPNGDLMADSGTFDEMMARGYPIESSADFSPFQIYFDEMGRMHGLGTDTKAAPVFPGFPDLKAGKRDAAAEQERINWPPIVEYSDTRVTLPLKVNNQTVAYAEFSEGPAFGQVINRSVQQALLIGGLAALATATLAALLTAHVLTGPVRSLGRAVADMANGDLDSRAPGSRFTEYNKLARQFNGMAERLRTTISSLEADRHSLRRFIADASHELRTPLTALMTFNQLLSRLPESTQEPAATYIAESGQQLSQLDRMTTGLLDLSRLDAGISGNDFKVSDMRLVVQRAIENFRPLALARDQQMNISLPPEPIMVEVDEAAIEKAIGNLLSNAVKYGSSGGKISVVLRARSEELEIIVKDDGPGIPADEQGKVFERFYRGRLQKVGGTGLELAISKEIVKLHGGVIRLESKPGQGCKFAISLPFQVEDDSIRSADDGQRNRGFVLS